MILRNRSLAALLVSEVVSSVGSRMTALALPWFVLVTTGSPTRMGVVLAAELLPMGLLGIPSGAVISRLGARRTMLVSDAVRVPLMASIPLLHAVGALSFPVLLALVFAFGVFWAPYFAAQRVILPELLGEDERTIAQANSVIEGATQTSGLLGPPIAGALIPLIGTSNVLYLDAATFAFSVLVVLLFVPARARAVLEETGGMFAGLGFFVRDELLGPFASVIVLYNALGQMLFAALPVLAFEHFHSAHAGGWLLAAFGAGGLLGTIVAFQVVTKVEPLKLVSTAVLGIALPIWLLAAQPPLALALVALALSAFSNPFVNAPFFGILTTRTPEALRAKVMTAVITLATIAGPLGLLAAGPLIEHAGLGWTFGIVAGGETAVSILFIALIARFRRAQVVQPEALSTVNVIDSRP
jgi:MFS family permease